VELDPSGKQTQGNITRYEVSPYAAYTHHLSTYSTTYNFTSNAFHSLVIEADLITGSGTTKHVVWKQDMRFVNFQCYWDNAAANVSQNTKTKS
jgi:hypothetical protein